MKPEVRCTCPWTDLFIQWDRVASCCYQLFESDYTQMTEPWAIWDDFSLAIDTIKHKNLQNDMREGVATCGVKGYCYPIVADGVDVSGNTLQLNKVTITTTYRCNAKCVYCPFVHYEGPNPNEPSLEQIHKLMHEIRIRNPKEVWLSGGDVLCLPEKKLAAYMDLECPIVLTTNGLGLSKARWERYLKDSKNSIRITIDSVDPEVYQKIRGPYCGKPLHEKLRSIMGGSDVSNVQIGCTINSDTIDGISDVIRFAHEMGFSAVWLNGIFKGNKYMEDRLLCFHAEHRTMQQLLDLQDKIEEWDQLAKHLGVWLKTKPIMYKIKAAIKKRILLDSK